MSDEPTVTRAGQDEFNYTRTQAELDERRADLLHSSSGHVWVMAMVYVVDDPMADPDTLSLEFEHLIKIVSLHCLGCRIGFRPGLVGTPCSKITQGPF